MQNGDTCTNTLCSTFPPHGASSAACVSSSLSLSPSPCWCASEVGSRAARSAAATMAPSLETQMSEPAPSRPAMVCMPAGAALRWLGVTQSRPVPLKRGVSSQSRSCWRQAEQERSEGSQRASAPAYTPMHATRSAPPRNRSAVPLRLRSLAAAAFERGLPCARRVFQASPQLRSARASCAPASERRHPCTSSQPARRIP